VALAEDVEPPLSCRQFDAPGRNGAVPAPRVAPPRVLPEPDVAPPPECCSGRRPRCSVSSANPSWDVDWGEVRAVHSRERLKTTQRHSRPRVAHSACCLNRMPPRHPSAAAAGGRVAALLPRSATTAGWMPAGEARGTVKCPSPRVSCRGHGWPGSVKLAQSAGVGSTTSWLSTSDSSCQAGPTAQVGSAAQVGSHGTSRQTTFGTQRVTV
jgi:hypothetical protein